MGINIREANENDVSAINDIRNYYILNSVSTVNIRPRLFEETLAWFLQVTKRYPFLVCELDGQVVAFGALGPFRPADGYAQTAEVSIYVHHEHLRKNIGATLMQKLCEKAPEYGFHCLVSVIVADNIKSIRLHERCGFTKKGLLEQITFKNDAYMDIILMTKLL